MDTRHAILAGLGLAWLTLVFTFGSALWQFPLILVLMTVVSCWYVSLVTRRMFDALPRKLVLQWGLAIGSAWGISALGVWLPDFEVFGFVLAILLPFGAGAAGAIQSGKLGVGTRVGVGAGMVGALVGFIASAGFGYLSAIISGGRVFETLAATEFAPIVFGVYILFVYGPVFCPLAATVGGWIGMQLAKTGRPSPAVR